MSSIWALSVRRKGGAGVDQVGPSLSSWHGLFCDKATNNANMPVSWCKRIYLGTGGVVALVTALCDDLKIDKFEPDLLTNERSVACGKGLAIRLRGRQVRVLWGIRCIWHVALKMRFGFGLDVSSFENQLKIINCVAFIGKAVFLCGEDKPVPRRCKMLIKEL